MEQLIQLLMTKYRLPPQTARSFAASYLLGQTPMDVQMKAEAGLAADGSVQPTAQELVAGMMARADDVKRRYGTSDRYAGVPADKVNGDAIIDSAYRGLPKQPSAPAQYQMEPGPPVEVWDNVPGYRNVDSDYNTVDGKPRALELSPEVKAKILERLKRRQDNPQPADSTPSFQAGVSSGTER
jgi:hypothetical protein